MTTSGDPRLPDHKPYRPPEQIAADQSFLAKARKISPQFPSVVDTLERRRRHNEACAARSLLVLAALSAGWAIYATDWHFPAFASAVFVVGFVITCIVAGNRQHVRNGGRS